MLILAPRGLGLRNRRLRWRYPNWRVLLTDVCLVASFGALGTLFASKAITMFNNDGVRSAVTASHFSPLRPRIPFLRFQEVLGNEFAQFLTASNPRCVRSVVEGCELGNTEPQPKPQALRYQTLSVAERASNLPSANSSQASLAIHLARANLAS